MNITFIPIYYRFDGDSEKTPAVDNTPISYELTVSNYGLYSKEAAGLGIADYPGGYLMGPWIDGDIYNGWKTPSAGETPVDPKSITEVADTIGTEFFEGFFMPAMKQMCGDNLYGPDDGVARYIRAVFQVQTNGNPLYLRLRCYVMNGLSEGNLKSQCVFQNCECSGNEDFEDSKIIYDAHVGSSVKNAYAVVAVGNKWSAQMTAGTVQVYCPYFGVDTSGNDYFYKFNGQAYFCVMAGTPAVIVQSWEITSDTEVFPPTGEPYSIGTFEISGGVNAYHWGLNAMFFLYRALISTGTTPEPGGDYPVSDNLPIFIFPTDKDDPNFVAGAVGTNLVSAFRLSENNVNALATDIWGEGWTGDIKNFFNNPIDAIIRLIRLPVEPPSDGFSYIFLGDYEFRSPGKFVHIQQEWMSVDLGTMEVARYFNNFLDYSPYTAVQLFLPFVGYKEMRADDVVGYRLHIVYQIDVLTGDCLAIIARQDDDGNEVPLYQYQGNCATEVPLGSSSRNIGGAISAGLGALATMAGLGASVPTAGTSAAAAAAVVGGITTTAGGVASAAQREQKRSGSISGNLGYTSNMYPFLVITRSIPDIPGNYNELNGRPSNKEAVLSSLSGYTEVEQVHVENIPCTKDEQDQISTLLKGGVIL